jgi:hypothetical protein
MSIIEEVIEKHSCIGIAGNRNSAKTSMVLTMFKGLRLRYPELKLAVMGVNKELESEMKKLDIINLVSKMDILDLQMKDTIIFVDEFALFFDTQTKSKQLDKLMRFFDRVEHLNCKIIVGTAREGFFNKFMCSRINCFLVKEIEYDSLVNGTWLKERVKAITSNSDYRMECEKSNFYIVANDIPTKRMSFKYSPEFDTKKNNVKLFVKNKVKK